MKHLVFCIPFLLFACSSKTETSSHMPLPFKEEGINLMDSVTRQFAWGRLILSIKYKAYDESPFLFSADSDGKIIDSLKLFDFQPHIGTDSQYLPWIEIDKAGIITRTNTSVYDIPKPPDKKSTEKFQVVETIRDTSISVTRFKVSKLGKFSKI